jgi:hypothetical protein
MKYIKVSWTHTSPTDPVLLYSELNSELLELRKVEVYADGTYGYADSAECHHSMGLSIEPLPPFSEIRAQSEFALSEISATDFEEIWSKSRKSIEK